MPSSVPNGVGLGLRWEFLEEVLEGPAFDVAFFEVSPENYMRRGGYYPAALERIAERYPIVTHGLTLSLGGLEEPPPSYLRELKREVERLRTPWHSDHLAFTGSAGTSLHELLPLAFSREALERVADRLKRVADVLGRPLAFENITYYAELGVSELSEADFIGALAERSGAPLLLDVNNVYVNGLNHGFDPRAAIAALPLERVIEIHVAGHTRQKSGLVVDTHGAPVADPVLELLEWTLERTGPVPVLLERDNEVPALPELLEEVAIVRAIFERAAARFARGREELRASGA
ncbi:MAG TPA: DUF692 domain-containing protein [Polyangiaceae bacterium]